VRKFRGEGGEEGVDGEEENGIQTCRNETTTRHCRVAAQRADSDVGILWSRDYTPKLVATEEQDALGFLCALATVGKSLSLKAPFRPASPFSPPFSSISLHQPPPSRP